MAYSDFHLFMDDIEVGQSWTSPARTVTETDIVNFAGLSGDFHPIHVDHEFASTGPFRKPIAHGILVMAISSGIAIHSPPMRTLAFVGIRDWQFLEPVFIGDTLHVRTTVVEKEIRSRGKRALITWLREIINQQEKVIQKGYTLTLVEGRAMHRQDD
ncbi:MAG TPA: MaoC/PaaZ C-terminal domain-containing protein [Gemmatales bacterium]|nr:MaoC/PaaZ C-terminal domain-containing protein [Gemmatales bacterium]